jgi:hypothetical protein
VRQIVELLFPNLQRLFSFSGSNSQVSLRFLQSGAVLALTCSQHKPRLHFSFFFFFFFFKKIPIFLLYTIFYPYQIQTVLSRKQCSTPPPSHLPEIFEFLQQNLKPKQRQQRRQQICHPS